MTTPIYRFPEQPAQPAVSADSIYTSAMTGLYGWTSLGMLVAGITGGTLHLTRTYLITGIGTLVITLFLALGLLMASHFTARRNIPFAVPAALYLAFTAVEGVTLAFIFAIFSPSTIIVAFGGALIIFTVMTIYGLRTGRDLSGLGQISVIALIGLVVAGMVNAFIFQSSGLELLISAVTIPIFMGLTAWETREIKKEAQKAADDGDAQAARRIALVGASGMFLSIMNMFLALLHLLSLDFGSFGGK